MSRIVVFRRTQRGAALMVALIILMLTMVVGVASLKQSVVQSRIATNTNATGIAFQAADTAVESVLAEFSGNGNKELPAGVRSVMDELATAIEVRRCVGGETSPGVCASLQGPGQVRARSVTVRADVPDRAVTGSSTDTEVWRFYMVKGSGSVGANAFAEVSHEQEFARREISVAGSGVEETGSAVGSVAP